MVAGRESIGMLRITYDRHSYDNEKREALDVWGQRLSIMLSEATVSQE